MSSFVGILIWIFTQKSHLFHLIDVIDEIPSIFQDNRKENETRRLQSTAMIIKKWWIVLFIYLTCLFCCLCRSNSKLFSVIWRWYERREKENLMCHEITLEMTKIHNNYNNKSLSFFSFSLSLTHAHTHIKIFCLQNKQ